MCCSKKNCFFVFQNAGSKVNINPIDQSSAEECKRLEQEAAKALELVQQCRKRRRELSDEARRLRKSIKTLEVTIPKLTMEIEGFDTSRKELTKLIPELRSKCDLSPEEESKLKELQTKVDKCKSDMASCEKLASKLEAEVAQLQKAILDAGGSKLKKQQKACEKILAELNDTEKSLNSAKVAITTNKKAAAKARKQMEAAEAQKQECKDLLAEKETEFKGLEEKAVKVLEAYESVKEVEAEKRGELEAAKKECNELKKSQAEARCLEIDLAGKVEALDRQLTDCKSKKKHWEKELSKLIAAEDDDDEFDFSDNEGDDDEEEGKENEEPLSTDDDGDIEMESVEAKGSRKKAKGPTRDNSKSNCSLPKLSFSALERYNVDDIKGDIDKLEAERNTLSKNANMGAIQEYRKKEADYLAR